MADGSDRVSHLAEHLRHMRRQGRSARTITARVDVLTKLADWLAADPVTATRADLEAWQDVLLAKSDNWLRWCTSIARPYYKFIHARGYRDDDPTALLVVPAARTPIPRPMAEPDVMHAIDNAPQRILPWLLLAGWCGLRAVEIARLRGEHFTVDAEHRVWIDIHGKGDHHRRVPVPLWMWPILSPHIPTEGWCFTMLYKPGPVTARHVSQYSANYLHRQGIAETLHSLRHRVATVTLRDTGNLRTVQQLLGHANLSSVHVYTHVAPADVADALDAIPQPRQSRGEVHRLRPRCADER